MMRMTGIAAALALAGCATAPTGIDATRFHLGGPIARGTVSVVPADATRAGSLEAATYSEAVAGALGRAGFQIAPASVKAEYIATFSAEQQLRTPAERRSGFSIGIGGGIGGGGYRSGGGVGGGVTFPVGERRDDLVAVNMLALALKRHSDGTQVWEGRASEEEPRRDPGGLAAAVPRLAEALLAGFPGPSGQTVRIKPPRGG